MITKLRKLIHAVFDWWDGIKGERYFKLGRIQQSADDGYTIETTNGFKIFIHCNEHVYVCVYLNSWTKNKKLSVYHIYCVCSNDTPPEIKEKLKGDLRISSFLHPWSSTESQKKQVIKAYIDMVLKNEI